MTHHGMPRFAVAAIAAALCATTALSDGAGVATQARDSATGDWNCRIGDDAIGTLSVRASSYVLHRSGASMAGEYQQAQERVIVTNGPLRGLGVDRGTLLADVQARTLEFPTASGALLSCREVL